MKRPVDRRDHVDGFALGNRFELGGRLVGFDRPRVHVAERVVGRRSGLGLFDGDDQLIDDRFLQLVLEFLGEEALFDEVLLEDLHRVLATPELHLFTGAIEAVVVVRGVCVVPIRLCFDEGGSGAGSGSGHGGLHRSIDLERVVAVDLDPLHPVTESTVGDGSADLFGGGHRDGVFVVLDDDDQGQFVNRRVVHRLVPVALGGGTLAAIDDDDRVFCGRS